MGKLKYRDNHYQTVRRSVPFPAKLYPSAFFYCRLITTVFRASRQAQKGQYDGLTWAETSTEVIRGFEDVGVRIDISGIENIEQLKEPCVIIGNHMSMMESLVLPAMVQPIKPVTFIVKETLLSYPVFKHIMRSRNPIAVSRTNPRQDLKTVLKEGSDRLQKNISIIVFPQTTRSHTFDPQQMNSIGVKLAKNAGVRIVPLALKTDCCQNGKILQYFGKIDLDKSAHFAFGEPIMVKGKGDEEQAAVNEFIDEKLKDWSGSVSSLVSEVA